MAQDKMLRISPDIHAELTRLSADYDEPIGKLADKFLAFITASMDRVDEALHEWQERGSQKARRRREMVSRRVVYEGGAIGA